MKPCVRMGTILGWSKQGRKRESYPHPRIDLTYVYVIIQLMFFVMWVRITTLVRG